MFFELDVYSHTVIAISCIALSYYIGRNWGRKGLVASVVGDMLDKLEKEGFIKTKLDKDGDKELIPISEIEGS